MRTGLLPAVSGGATQYANPGTAMGAGCMAEQSFGITLDADKNARYSKIFRFRGAASTTLEEFDIAAGANGVWTTLAAYGGIQNATVYDRFNLRPTIQTQTEESTCISSVNGTQRMLSLRHAQSCLEPWKTLWYTQGAAIVGGRLATTTSIDGATKVGVLMMQLQTGAQFFDCILQR